MAALDLHHAIFADGIDLDPHFRPATSFLHLAPERDGNATSCLSSSAAFQDLVQRQPTHPDGPMSGWDLGLNLLGDPITATERKSLRDHQTKMKLRRLHAINVTFELLFGAWGTYTTVRYCLAFTDDSDDTRHVCALVLGTVSALAVAFVFISILIPLFPPSSRIRTEQYPRSFLRACYLLLLSAGAVSNFVLVLLWHPTQLCSWDVDISWYTSARYTVTSPCRTVSFTAWITGAIVRLLVTLTMALSFVYTLRSYHEIRHPFSEQNSRKYSPYLPSDDPEDISPVSPSSPLRFSKSNVSRFMRSNDSNHILNQSNVTLPKYNSISSFTPSTSCTAHSRSHSTPPLRDVSLPRLSPPRSTAIHPTSHGSQAEFETPFQMQMTSAATAASWVPRVLRRMRRISVAQVTPDTMLVDSSLHSPTIARVPPEIRSCASCQPGHRGGGVRLDVGKMTLARENVHVRHASQGSGGPQSFLPTHDDGESIEEKVKDLVYSYGYGASGPTYPYLDMYNPQRPEGYAETSPLCEDVDERGLSQGYWQAIPGEPALQDVSSESQSLPRRKGGNSGEEEEYVAMMRGFVRRMATIESLGSKEAAGTLSTTTGSVALHSLRSGAPASQFSSVRFADLGSSRASLGVSLNGSFSTAYLSFSSGGTGMEVSERGELFPGLDVNRSAASSPHDRHYYTASGSSLARTDEEDR